MKLPTLNDLIHIDEIKEEAAAVGMLDELSKNAKLIIERENEDHLVAYQRAYQLLNTNNE